MLERSLQSIVRGGRRLRAAVFQHLRGEGPVVDERQSWAEIKQMQQRRLAELLRDAGERIPFWRERLDAAGVLADGRVNLNRFHRLPLLERDDLTHRFDELVDPHFPGRTWVDQTGGSTGEPVRIVKDAASKAIKLRAKWQMHRWAGFERGKAVAYLWGAERDIMADRVRLPLWKWPAWDRICCDTLEQNAFRMGLSEMEQYLREWAWFRPHGVIAYVDSIHDLALFAEQSGIVPYAPAAIITSAGTLMPQMKQKVSEVFQCPVFNRYGSREFGNMAMSCAYDAGLHVMSATEHIEILRSDGAPTQPGEEGEIVVTSLTARAMPLIRYRIGDRGYWNPPCPCGRPLPVIGQVTGRSSDVFVAPNGQRIHGEFFTHLLWHRSWCKKFQVVQEAMDHVRFRIVLDDRPAFDREAEEHELAVQTRKALGEACRVSFEYPDAIEPTATGKHRYTISRLASSRAGEPTGT